LYTRIVTKEWTLREVSEQTGLSTHTLRYYERAGLLAPIARTEGGHRRYSERDIDSLLFLTKLRLTGMPIQGVRRYADLARQGASTISSRQQILQDHRATMIQQREEIERNLAAIDYKIALYERGWVPEPFNDPALAELRQLCAPPTQSI